jgi:protein tyrosine phosphatase
VCTALLPLLDANMLTLCVLSVEIHVKFVDLEWAQRERFHKGEVVEDDGQADSQWSRLNNAEVARRNRYVNVDPYAYNRVRLRVPEGHNDYINASPIRLGSKENPTENSTETFPEKFFIATQVGQAQYRKRASGTRGLTVGIGPEAIVSRAFLAHGLG